MVPPTFTSPKITGISHMLLYTYRSYGITLTKGVHAVYFSHYELYTQCFLDHTDLTYPNSAGNFRYY